MRKLLALTAAFALLVPGLAMAQIIARSQTGAVGNLVTCTDPSGNTGRCVLQAVTPTDSSGKALPAGAATSTDASGTVTAGGTYQTVFASNTARRGCLLQNPSTASEPLSVKVGTMAQPFTLGPGAAFSCATAAGVVATDTVTATAATTGHAFAAVSQ